MTKNKVTINTPTTELGTAFNSIHTDLDFPGYPVIDDTKSLQSCPTLCDPMSCRPAGSSAQRDSLSKNSGVGFHAFLQ